MELSAEILEFTTNLFLFIYNSVLLVFLREFGYNEYSKMLETGGKIYIDL
jgi:hypothetical protein